MISFRCSRCKATCQVSPSHAGRLHTCEHCGLILTAPGKPVRPSAPVPTRRLGIVEILIGGGVVVSVVAMALVYSVLSNRTSQVARPVQAGATDPAPARVAAAPAKAYPVPARVDPAPARVDPAPAQITVVVQPAKPADTQRPQPPERLAGQTPAMPVAAHKDARPAPEPTEPTVIVIQ